MRCIIWGEREIASERESRGLEGRRMEVRKLNLGELEGGIQM